jgi:hypothetical protein
LKTREDQGPPSATIVCCGGNAKPSDTHLFCTVRAVDEEIIDWLARRAKREKRKLEKAK